MAFEINDFVKIKDVASVVPEDRGALGRVVNIDRIRDTTFYKVMWCSSRKTSWISERWLEPMSKKGKTKTIVVASDGKEIKVVLGNGAVGVARCHPEDKFDVATGFKLAYERAKEQFIPSLGDSYYIPSPTAVLGARGETLTALRSWRNNEVDNAYFKRKMVFKTREEAQKAAKKMIAALKN